MGDRHDTVTVQPFCMDLTEVTVSAYTGCVSANACAEPSPYMTDEANRLNRACNWKRPGAGLHPVNCVDWGQATSYCAWAGKRLPTEEEWEWAARGASQARTYPWGNDAPSADRLNACGTECVTLVKSNFGQDWTALYQADDGWPTTAPVGSFPRGATPQGLQDMGGNVREWTSSNFDATARVVRGGSWNDDVASIFRAALRGRDTPSYRYGGLGFRCAR
jgi:formylglycine-generating enzyme required for sulfatase activity